MRTLVKKLSYEPKIYSWLIFFFFSFICTVVPLLGPAFMGFILYKIVRMGEVKRMADAYIPTVLGIFAFTFIFYLPSWPFENFIIVTFLNIGCLAGGSGWVRFFS